GAVKKVRLARFEDSGKCKGIGFLDFEDIESVTRALSGKGKDEDNMDVMQLEGKDEGRAERGRRRVKGERLFFKGRKLRMEYGEDAEVRYKKRWGGKGKPGHVDAPGEGKVLEGG